ncbi:S-layer homology domain-containing protein [Sporosarcina sp. FSL K6-3457]|uniref:S-layer homology domain-containing protein n=1 Tax=Sporosarcina sp. FSL K6-3457 TaxID=2978204 RepID=UPI0030FB367F
MRQLNYEKLFKATLATTVAAGAIVAVTPVNTEAATRTFSDVKDIPSHHFYEAVMDLSSRGIIGGYPDGTFKPSQNISRQHAATFLALSLGLDTVNVKDPGFKDVNKKNPYYGAIAALVEAGIISGYADNTFKPNDNLTRTQMAKILVLGFNFKSQGAQSNPFSDITNSKWNKSYIQVLYANKITTGTTPTTFSPNAFVTRGQLASFIFRSEAATTSAKPTPTPKPDPVPEAVSQNQRAVEAAANQVKGGSVTLPNGQTTTDAQKLAAVQTYATGLVTDKAVSVKVTKATKSGSYIVALTKGSARATKNISMRFEAPAPTHYVTNVKSLNAKQVEVTFAAPVSKSTVLDAWNVVQNMSITTSTSSTRNPGQLAGALSADGKTVTITAANSFHGDYTFTSTDAIKSTANEAFEKHTATLKVNDTTAPKLVSGSTTAKTSTNSFSLFFDEPVSAAGATAYVNNTAATITNNSTDPKRLDITARTSVQVGATARISVTNVKDYNNNSTSPNTVETTITVGADTTAPTVTNVRVTTDNKIELTYDKDMDISSFAGMARVVYPNGSTSQLTASAGWNARTVILSGASSIYNNTYNTVLYIDAGVKDKAGYKTTQYSTNLSFNQDTIAPSLTSVEWRDGKIIAYFTENIALSTNNVITAYNQNTGIETSIYLNYYNGSNTTVSNNTLTIQQALPDGYYQLRIPANTVVDKAPVPNSNSFTTQTFSVQNYGWDTASPLVYGITNGSVAGDLQTVTYTVMDENSGVNLDTVRDLTNYTWDGYALPAGSSVSTSVMTGSIDKATSVSVIIYVPTASIPTTKTAAFTVNHLQDNAGNKMLYANSGDVTFVSNYQNQPEFTNATIGSDNSSLILSFSTSMYGIDKNDFAITLNGQTVQANSVTPIYDNRTFSADIRASVANDTTTADNRYGDVIYLDTNGDYAYDFGDLVLEVVEDFRYGADSYGTVPIGNYVTSLTVTLIEDHLSPAQDQYGNRAKFGQEYRVR